MESFDMMNKSVRCLALELPEPVYDDVAAKWQALKNDLEQVRTLLNTVRSELQADKPMIALDIVHNIIERKLI